MHGDHMNIHAQSKNQLAAKSALVLIFILLTKSLNIPLQNSFFVIFRVFSFEYFYPFILHTFGFSEQIIFKIDLGTK
jgi:hypothetical protein